MFCVSSLLAYLDEWKPLTWSQWLHYRLGWYMTLENLPGMCYHSVLIYSQAYFRNQLMKESRVTGMNALRKDWLRKWMGPSSTCTPSQHSSAGKESACNVGDPGSIPGLERSPREGKGHPLQYSGLENSMDCIVYGAAKSWTWLRDLHFHFPSTNFGVFFFFFFQLF